MAVKMALRSRWPLVRSASLLFRSIELTQRVTIPEIMLTAVEIAPRMIRIEMIGVRIFAPALRISPVGGCEKGRFLVE